MLLFIVNVQTLPIDKIDNVNGLSILSSLRGTDDAMLASISNTDTMVASGGTPVKLKGSKSAKKNKVLEGLKKVLKSLGQAALKELTTNLPWSSAAACSNWKLAVEVCHFMAKLQSGGKI